LSNTISYIKIIRSKINSPNRIQYICKLNCKTVYFNYWINMVSLDKKNDLKKFITKDINLWLARIAGTMLPSVTGITLESLLPSMNKRLSHDTRIHRRHSEYIPTANFLFIIFTRSHTNFSISLFWNQKQTIPISLFLEQTLPLVVCNNSLVLFRW
jgi:hypothetical protein